MVSRSDYSSDGVRAARAVMLELYRLRGAYKEQLVVVGGWVPNLLIPQEDEPHVGSMDIDLAINHRSIPDEGYKTIQALLDALV